MVFLRRYGHIILWFIPALAAFANAIVLKVQERPPLRQIIYTSRATIETISKPGEELRYSMTFQGETDFVNEYPANLRVYTHDRPYGAEPTYKVKIFRDGTYYDSQIQHIENNLPLTAGKHNYHATVAMRITTYAPITTLGITLQVEYPPKGVSWQYPGLLGMVFLTIGAFQLNHMRRQ